MTHKKKKKEGDSALYLIGETTLCDLKSSLVLLSLVGGLVSLIYISTNSINYQYQRTLSGTFNVPVKKDNEITIATINVRTLKDDIKFGSTFEVFQSLRHDFICMPETRRLAEGIIDQNGSRFIWKRI